MNGSTVIVLGTGQKVLPGTLTEEIVLLQLYW